MSGGTCLRGFCPVTIEVLEICTSILGKTELLVILMDGKHGHALKAKVVFDQNKSEKN